MATYKQENGNTVTCSDEVAEKLKNKKTPDKIVGKADTTNLNDMSKIAKGSGGVSEKKK